MNSASSLTIQDCWQIALRRKWWIIGGMLISLAVAGALCKLLPKSYRSSTLILVESQKIPERYVQGVVSGTVQERLTMIKQQVMSRTVLGGVIEEFGLYKDEVDPLTLEGAINRMRNNVEVEIKGNREHVEAFTISFAHEDPVTAMKVASRLTSKFIEENLKHREQFIEGAAEFLDQELERAKAELEKKEQEISEFKSRHIGELPQQMEANLRALDRIQGELLALEESDQRTTTRLDAIQRAISEYEATGKTTPDVVTERSGALQLVRRLKELEQRLTALSAEYKPTYPDIVSTRQEIKSLRTTLKEEYGDEVREGETAQIDPYKRELEKQRRSVESELALLKKRQQQLLLHKREYEARVERAPTLEQELLILVRDYENMKSNYNTLLDKRLNARVAENLERRQKGERFRVIDPANVPSSPEKPNLLRIMLIGLLAGCGLGFGSAFTLELLNPNFRRPEDLETHFGLHVLAEIPDFEFFFAKQDKRGRRKAADEPLQGPGQETTVDLGSDPKKTARLWPRRRARPGGTRALETNLVAKWRPRSIVAEQYRVAATQVSLLEAARASSIIVVTSSVKDEGKSTTAANMAYTLAQDLNKRTLLVDCDLKCPSMHHYFSLPAAPGLSEVLQGKAALEHALRPCPGIPLWVLPIGSREGTGAGLPQGEDMAKLFTDLRSQFHYVIADAPPILPLADMNVLAHLADLTLVVVRAGVTQHHVVSRALVTLRGASQPHFILNGVESSSMPYYMHYDYHARPAETHST